MALTILVLLTLCVVGGAFAFMSMRNRTKKAAAATWITAPGMVTASAVLHEQERGSDGVSHTYMPRVLYTYAVDGVEHQGSRIAFSNTRSANVRRAQSWCDRFPAETAVTVYYDPAKPQDAVLDRGLAPSA